MTSADYLAIAISPALIMALVGSLVFFLVEVLYVGQYQFRLNYAFALFVFAAVLIARISIEMGSERAVLFALPLGLVMYLFMLKFVEHPTAYSHVINAVLLVVVWWCAHQLTWDSTVIDDSEDASGEGLMQRLGVDGPDGAKTNELLEGTQTEASKRRRWWHRFNPMRSGPHTPGTWVLYFSLAALPLFGIGQLWIPASEVGRRRYVFFLLLVYVAAALSLLVSTSFLNLRRYLRQRRVEMPLPIAGTWVGVGAVLVALVMLLAALVPRPNAEIALSRVPWQAGSPDGLSASRSSVLRDGREPQQQQNVPTGASTGENGQPAERQQDSQTASRSNATAQSSDESQTTQGEGDANARNGPPGNQQSRDAADSKDSGNNAGQSSDASNQNESQPPSGTDDSSGESMDTPDAESDAKPKEQATQRASSQPPSHADPPGQRFMPHVEGLDGLLKMLLYVVGALLIAFLAWRYRQQLLQSIADIWRQLRELFGGKRAVNDGESEAIATAPRRPSFSEFSDPFASGQQGRWTPEELVRYTFAAFEAWADDRGSPRTPDCTPQELVSLALEPKTPIHDEARRLVRLYSQLAYASHRVPSEAANELSAFWQMMRSAYHQPRNASA
jgi:hypothetical protein